MVVSIKQHNTGCMLYNRTVVSINKYEVATLATDVEKEREREEKTRRKEGELADGRGTASPHLPPLQTAESGFANICGEWGSPDRYFASPSPAPLTK